MNLQHAHICLVSAQLLPNLIPALMLKPDTVHLIVTADMQTQATRLERLLRASDMQTVQHNGAPSTGMAAIRDFVLTLAEELNEEIHYTLNATGGTKLMALAFVQVLPELLHNVEVLYTDTEHSVLEMLTGTEPKALPMHSVLTLDTYLRAYGLQRRSALSDDAEWLERTKRLKPLTKWLAQQAALIEGFIGALNYAAEQAIGHKEDPFRARQELQAWGQGAKALEEIAKPEYELLTVISKDTVEFSSLGAAHYLGGTWMEDYAWWILKDAGAEDAQSNVQVVWQDGDKHNHPPNELDAVAVHHNRLLLIECKTVRFGKSAVKDQEILNRLESLGRNVGGLFGKAVLVSARRLKDDMRSRAQAYKLDWFDCTNLRDFKPAVVRWLQS